MRTGTVRALSTDRCSVPDEVEVAIVGAGPTGLTMATMLAVYGIRAVVLDGAAGPARHSRAAVVHARTLETLEPLGVVGRMLATGVVVPHFGVRDRDRRLLAVNFDGLPTAHPYTLMLPQDETEGLLRETLHQHGGSVFWEHEVTGVRRDGARVDLMFRSPQGTERLRAQFVAGCDGAHSTVRDKTGIRFEGATYPRSFVLADVRLDWQLPDDEVQLFFSPDGLVVVAPLPHGRCRVVATVEKAPAEPSLSDIQALLDHRGPREPRPSVREILWSSRFRVHHKLAARFREGPVFLCGDAAHVHSPAGGQGMNTGIQDAANLAWKLALVLRWGAPGSLLDSYERERRPVAQDVVSTTHRITRLATVRSPIARTFRNVSLTAAGRLDRLPRRLAANLAQIDIAYRDGWSVDGSTTVERWACGGNGVLRDPAPTLTLVVPEGQKEKAVADVARFGFERLPVGVSSEPGLRESRLVRPDGYVAGRAAAGEQGHLLVLLARKLAMSA